MLFSLLAQRKGTKRKGTLRRRGLATHAPLRLFVLFSFSVYFVLFPYLLVVY